MKFTFQTRYLSLFFLVLTCCGDIEEEVFSEFPASDFYKNEDQLQSQSLGMYNTFKHVVWEWWMYDILVFPSKYAVTRNVNEVWWKKAVYGILETNQANRYNDVWGISYNCVNRANTIVKYAETSPIYKDNPDLVKQYIAEARWFRAYCYFNLVQLFGDVPLYEEPTENNDYDVLFKARTSKNEIYKVIKEDLIYASEYLPVKWEKTLPGRVTKATAIMLLGKVYLTTAGLPLNQTGNYEKTISTLLPLANNPNDYNVELLSDWKSIFNKKNEGNKEILFAFGKIYENQFGSVLPFHSNPLNSPFAANGGGYNMAWSYDLVELYDDNDIRKYKGFTYSYVAINNGNTIIFDKNSVDPNATTYASRNGICSTKYIDGEASQNVQHEKDVIVYRYADVFLMLAEAYLEINKPTEAKEYLKVIRDRVNANEVTTTNQLELRQIIRDERMRELYGEYTELYDMRRWGTAKENYLNHPVRLWRTPSRGWDEKYLLSPIPDNQRSANPNLTQNQGW
jgi:hypothetical protein